jgi:superfamily I DNA/RNA helicase
LCAIGDPNQAIYGFRGSDVTYFNQFLTDSPGASCIHLTRNYRSTRTILAAANQVIQKACANRSAVKTYSRIEGQRTIHVMQSRSAKAEAVAVGKVIERLVGGSGFHAIDFGKVDGNSPTDMLAFKDFAVLYRTRAQGEVFAPVLAKAGIPYQIASRRIHYHEGPLAGLLSLLKVVLEKGSYLDFKNISRWMGAGIGEKTWQRFKSWGDINTYDLSQALHHARRLPIPEMQQAQQSKLNALSGRLDRLRTESVALTGAAKVRYLLERTNLRKHPKADAAFEDGLRHLLDAAERFGSQAQKTLTHLSLESDTDLYDSRSEKVALMTLHAAKGLEFPVVFIVGCEDNYLPLRRTNAAPVDLEEERRLFYVAMTRAREQLFLSWAQSRRIYGKKSARFISPFVVDIENRLKRQTGIESSKRRPSGQTQLELF